MFRLSNVIADASSSNSYSGIRTDKTTECMPAWAFEVFAKGGDKRDFTRADLNLRQAALEFAPLWTAHEEIDQPILVLFLALRVTTDPC